MKTTLKKLLPLIGIGGLILFAGIHVFLDQRKTSSLSASSDDAVPEGIRLKDIQYSHADPKSKTTWLMDAAEVTISMDRRYMSFRNFLLKVHPQDRPRLELTGQRGDYDTETGEMILRGDIRGKTENGYTFETEYAVYNQKRGDLETHEPVLITGPFFSIQGRGLSLDVNREVLRIHSEVTTRIKDRTWVL